MSLGFHGVTFKGLTYVTCDEGRGGEIVSDFFRLGGVDVDDVWKFMGV